MQIEQERVKAEIREVLKRIWENTLELTLVEESRGNPSGGSAARLTAIEIKGAWSGCLTMRFSEELAQEITRRMFDLSRDTHPSEQQLLDCLKEIANVTGGNLKTILPEPCELSLPRVENQSLPTLRALAHLYFASGSGHLEVALRKE